LSELNHPYLKQQLITYIGNKRRLLPLINQAIEKTDRKRKGEKIFLDLFSGSGVVSRLARLRGMKVYSNDWEYYAGILNKGFLTLNEEDLPALFGSRKILTDLLEELNNLPHPAPEDQYMARYYAPSHFEVEKADFRTERLFYTRENALRIDGIRNFIECEFPADRGDQKTEAQRCLLLSLLLYESSIHTNTSGVFKAYHKGFGGHGKDALNRILGDISLKYPILPQGQTPAEIFCSDANTLAGSEALPDADIAYLDPPYNQHQYGSNYHILNTIARWDRIPAPLTLNDRGVLKEKAAIRKDWIRTRSPYCYRDSAAEAFSDLIDRIRAEKILISYSNDGIIPMDRMIAICEKRGRVDLVTNEYTKFRGGRQSNRRLHTNIEFVMMIDTGRSPTVYSGKKMESVLLKKKIRLCFRKMYSRRRLAGQFDLNLETGEICTVVAGKTVRIATDGFLKLNQRSLPEDLTPGRMKTMIRKLESSACHTREEELNEIFLLLEEAPQETSGFVKEIPGKLKMLAHRKTRSEFEYWMNRYYEKKGSGMHVLDDIEDKMAALKILAARRFQD